MASVPGAEIILNQGRKLPEGKWVYLTAMVLAVPALALSWYKFNIRVAGLCAFVMLILIAVTKICLRIGDKQSGVSLRWQVWFFSWFCIFLFVVVSLTLCSSMLFGAPKINWSFLDPPSAKADTTPTDSQAVTTPTKPAVEEPNSTPSAAEPQPTTQPQADTRTQVGSENEAADADFDEVAKGQERQGDEEAFHAIAHMIDGDMVLAGRTKIAENTPEQEQERVRSHFEQARNAFWVANKDWKMALGDSVDATRKIRLEAKLKDGNGITCIEIKANKNPENKSDSRASCRANGTRDHLIHLSDGQEFSVGIVLLHNF